MKMKPMTLTRTICSGVIMPRITGLGRKPMCNLNVDRAPNYRGWCFPLCWRCTAILFPFLAFDSFIQVPITLHIHTVVAIGCMVPTIIDGVLQYFFQRESTNTRRILTGLLCGVGLVLLQ